jgi:hypothetical protein
LRGLALSKRSTLATSALAIVEKSVPFGKKSELGVLASQCLDRRIADKQILAHEVNAWQDHRNKHHLPKLLKRASASLADVHAAQLRPPPRKAPCIGARWGGVQRGPAGTASFFGDFHQPGS